MKLRNHKEDLIIEEENGVLVILSDLHMGEGYLPEKRVFARAENFFQDAAFYKFLEEIDHNYAGTGKRITLIVNGDFLDFLRVRSLPQEKEHLLFQRYLRLIGKNVMAGDFTIDENEKSYGLSSQELKSVWKLRRICHGHPRVFEALAELIVHGHRLIIVKGNHDLEFYWPKVQKEFRKLLACKLPALNGEHKTALERARLLETNVLFCQRAVMIEGAIYVEHGHQYEPVTSVLSTPERNGELALPPGSIFNRYLINAIENVSPIIANVRPLSEFMRTLPLSKKLQTLRVLLRYFPVASKHLIRHHNKYGLVLFLEAVPYLAALLYFIFGVFFPVIWKAYGKAYIGLMGETGAFLVKNWFLNLWLSYFGFLGLKKAMTFAGKNHNFNIGKAIAAAKQRLGSSGHRTGQQRFIVYSHTHRVENRSLGNGWWYINTGTWIPIIDGRDILMHQKLTLSYVLFEKDEIGNWDFQLLQWNDAKGKSEKLILLESENG